MSRLIAEANRRKILIAAIAFAGVAVALGPSALRLIRDFAQSGDALDDSTRAAMVRMARLLYPHDAISDDVYAEALDQALTAAANDQSFAETLRSAEEALDAQQPAPFVQLDEAAQIAAMKAVEDREFFATIQEAVRTRLYSHPAVWSFLGYEGPSFEKGGYLNRGAGVVPWLTEAQ